MPTKSRSSADKCRDHNAPLLYALEHFGLWRLSKDRQSIIFIFADDSKITFKASSRPQEAV